MGSTRKALKAIPIAGLLALGLGCDAFGQSYPDKFVKVVIPVPPGGVQDQLARQLGVSLGGVWKQPVIVESKLGGSGLPAIETVRQSKPDGYTILMLDNFNLMTNQFLRAKKYEFNKAMAPITSIAETANVLVANPKFPAGSFAEFVALVKSAKEKPDYGSLGVGSAGHLEMETLLSETGLSMNHVPYKGGAGLSAALINGEVSVGLLGTTTAISFIRDGRLKGLSVFAKERIPAIPDVPTLREAGSTYQPLPAWFGWWAPVDTPREIVEKVSNDVGTILSNPGFVDRNVTPFGLTVLNEPPAKLTQRMADEGEMFERRVRPLHIQFDD
jgi:tripartite-type tricarboxylate transporter receptor subunit TctC